MMILKILMIMMMTPTIMMMMKLMMMKMMIMLMTTMAHLCHDLEEQGTIFAKAFEHRDPSFVDADPARGGVP